MSAVTTGHEAAAHPEHVGRFRIERLLGMGSMGAVYLAQDPVISRQVAIKTLNLSLPPQQAKVFEDNFLNEARAAGRLSHPHIVTVYDAGRIDGQSYIAMEYLKGVELKDLISRGEPFTMRQFAEIFIRVADALQYAHDNGIVHRDIKPANIFLTTKTQPKVLDFGIAQAAANTLSTGFLGGIENQTMVGTPNYMSPELIAGRSLDGRSDIFSLGVVMYEVLTRRVPFVGKTFEELTHNIVHAHPAPPQDSNPDVPLPIAKIVAQALAKNPAERYASARDLADDLRRYIASVRARQLISAGAKPPVIEEKRSRLPLVVGLAVPLALAVAGVAWWATSTRERVVARTPVVVPQTEPAPVAVAPKIEVPAPVPEPVVEKPAVKAAKADDRPRKDPPPAKSLTPPALPIALGTVSIAVSPWGELFVDGVPRGLSPPVSSLTLPAGKHTIEIRNGDSEPYKGTIEVSADETTRVRHRF
ncbi:hypothetical protein BH10PSE17_BH10PSE17_28400 [soil metagenome]